MIIFNPYVLMIGVMPSASHNTVAHLTHLDGTPRRCAKDLLTGGQVNRDRGKNDAINAPIEVLICYINEVVFTRVATKVHSVRHIGEEFCHTRRLTTQGL